MIKIRFLIFLSFALLATTLHAQDEADAKPTEAELLSETLTSLESFVELQANLKADIKKTRKLVKSSASDAEKAELAEQLKKLEEDLNTVSGNFEKIASGSDIDTLRAPEEQKFKFQEELMSLIEPAIKEMKDMTSDVRQKSALKEKIAYFSEKLPIAEQAVSSIINLYEKSNNKAVKNDLKALLDTWEKQLTFMQSELQAAELQLDKLLSNESSFTESSGTYLKSFFQKRGLYLFQALLVVIAILVISRLTYAAMTRFIPGYKREHRSFRIRLLDLFHRLLTVILAIAGPMIVFYVVEDWVLFSIGILLLIGIGWTLRQALPRYWKQIQLFLNVGSVREGERLYLDGLPWRVQQINIFSTLENPAANLKQRVPLDDLIDLKSRPVRKDEPWFPCRKGDWVILSDGIRGMVTGISQEMVQLIQRGGAHCTYLMSDFLGHSPKNLAPNFRLKETIGITYDLQAESTSTIPGILEAHVIKRLDEEGYGSSLLNLRVEFERANTSSLDIVVIADFKGDQGHFYNRLRRAIQRYCVEACTLNNWEIPFQQVTLHNAAGS